MDAFWHFARRLLRHRGLLALALLFAAISAGGLGVGVMGMYPILQNIFPEDGTDGKLLPELATEWSAAMHESIGVRLPESWIAALPDDRFNTVL